MWMEEHIFIRRRLAIQQRVALFPQFPPESPSPAAPLFLQDPCVFDATSICAVGDGSTDDTDAFTSAWREACAVVSAVLLAPV
ncbi:hypothetical protein FRX31_002667 [Thalictrum thalictroides]|uniref:Uncharacterized protein n=1 Tax=Thalictrum thalictroides TaxID=46969 RepID=A0A7J6XFC7_THATH|nr:hypothetical protein FRX31_002667 [Thalictrum thalictroides]